MIAVPIRAITAWKGMSMRRVKHLRAPILAAVICSLSLHAASSKAHALSDSPASASYEMSCRVLPESHKLEAEVIVNLPASTEEREKLAFELYSDMSVAGVDVLTPTTSQGPAEIIPAGETMVWGEAFPGNKKWEIKPLRPFPKGSPVSLKVKYSGGQKQGFSFYLGPEGSFANTSLWYPSFGVPVTGVFRYAVPDGYSVKATGSFVSKTESNTETIFIFRVAQPSGLSFAAARYLIHRRWGAVPITLYLLKDRSNANDYVEGTRRVVQVLEREFGKFPRDEFAIVETPSAQSLASGFGGASAEGFILAESSYLDQGFSTAYFGHEIGHQWWGVLVKRKQDEDAGMFMTDEAMAQYGALRCVEEIEGPVAAEGFRRTGYPGFSHFMESGLGALMFHAADLDCPLARLGPPCASMANYELSDSKGFLVYYVLSQTVGRDNFRRALKAITTKYAYGEITWDDFLKEIERSTGRNLNWFYDQWFNRAGVPQLVINWEQKGRALKCRITQQSPAYRLAMPLEIKFENGSALTRTVEIAGAQTALALTVRQAVRSVELDPHYTVFHSDPELKAEAEDFRYWVRGNLHRINGREEEGLKVLTEGLQHLPEADPYGVEFMLRFHVAAILRSRNQPDEAERQLELALESPSRVAEFLPVAYLRIAEIEKGKGNVERLGWAVMKVRSSEQALGHDLGFYRKAKQLLEAR